MTPVSDRKHTQSAAVGHVTHMTSARQSKTTNIRRRRTRLSGNTTDRCLDALLHPSSVAVIGASRSPGKVGHEIFANIREGGFEGTVVPVNPSATEILGVECISDLATFGGPVDLCVVAVPAPAVAEAVDSAIKAKARAIVVVAAGFGETGSEGALAESRLAERCAQADVRLLGPNCLGLINTGHRLNATFARGMPQPGGISVLSQSGALCTAILDWAQMSGLGLAKVISIGNKADIDEADILETLAADEQTKIVVGYLENISSGERFLRAACAVTSSKPFVLFRAGVTKAGMWTASAHTGYLAGADPAYAAAFKRAGIIRADSLDALWDFASGLSRQPLPRGNRLSVITNSGGPGVIAADAIERAGMKLAHLDGSTVEALKARLPLRGTVHNPIDVLGDANPQRYADTVSAVLQEESVDGAIVILTSHAMTKPVETVEAIAARAPEEKPLLLVCLGATNTVPLAGGRVPVYPSPERAVATLRAMHDYRVWLNRPEQVIVRFPVNRRRVERIIKRHRRAGRLRMSEVDTKKILQAYDLKVPDGAVAHSPQEAVDVAERIGFPVAMKIVSADVLHKSDVGGVKLNVSSAADVRDTFDLLVLRADRGKPAVHLDGVYVEKMCGQGVQVVLGTTYDPRFGPLLMFGLGGTLVDRLDSLSYHMAPVTAEEAVQMLSETRSYALLSGLSDGDRIDFAAIVGALQRISQLATDFPEVKELNIDPYLVGTVGVEPVVVDARITLFAGMDQ
ncbi:MAG: acetate--CoA ligase family protein [Phycisphaerales bacterium]|nr:MAG: acetate--CoA ligase family protein [Phycisphaerales bacterium]